jgi:neopullulanase
MRRPDSSRSVNAALAILCLLVSAVGAAAVPQTKAPSISKVEPPSWWASYGINPVRLLVRGQNLSGARVWPTNPAIRVSQVFVNRSGTYLFVSVGIAGAPRPGLYPLIVETAAGRATIPFTIEPALNPKTHFQGITSDDVIYLIMPDRFANGDQSNDSPAGSPAAANDRRNPRAYHGGDLRGIINNLQYFKDLGVTALWLTPWYDNWNGINACDKPWCPNTYYHGYHAIDYYAVEDRFGDLATLRELVAKAHAMDIKIIQDQVANHVGSRHPWVTDPPLDDWFHGTAEHHTLNKFQNSVLLSPHANSVEVRNTLDGWFNDDLPDMNQERPEVTVYEIQNALWWIGATGLDGVRQDTIQYMPREFIRDLSDSLHRQYPRMWMVGEVFERDAAHTSYFVGGHKGWDGIDTKLDSVFDFALWNASLLVFTNKLPMRAVRDQLEYDALYPDASRVTVMTNNHDTPRFMSLEGASLEGAMLHVAFTLSVRGIPQLYYGEEIAMAGEGDPDNRRDFPGGFPGDSRNAFTAQGRTTKEQRMYDWTRDWIRLRREHSAIRQGRLIDLFHDDDAYVFARQDKTETVIIAINRANKEKNITLPVGSIGLRDGAELTSLIGQVSRARVANERSALTIPAQSGVAYIVR